MGFVATHPRFLCLPTPLFRLPTLLVALTLLLTGRTQAQTTYYLSNAGNDANAGQSPDAPFLTLGKINSLSLRPGDAVLFRRGDTFRGTLTLRQSGTADKPIRIDAYGTGERPILSGAVPLTNWTATATNRWQAGCSDCGNRVTGVYRNGTPQPIGRYPNLSDANRGYLTVQAHSGKTQLTSQQPLTTNWVGGEVVVRPVQWILDRATITGQNGNTLTLSNSSNYNLGDNWGYFIQNHPATLDQNGEWYYDPATRTVQLYLADNPNKSTLSATAADEAVLISGNYVSVQNLHVTQARVTNLRATNATGLILSDLSVSNAGEDGIRLEGSGSNVVVQNTQLYRINNNGINADAYPNLTIRRNSIRNVGTVAGRGRSGDGQSVGILSNGSGGLLLEDNVLDSLGFNGICFVNNALIQRNIVSNFCLTKSDGGGIYVWNGNKQVMYNNRILSNIVFGGTGASEGTPGGAYSGANGIYLDDCTTNLDVKANTVFGCAGLGIFLHATSNTTISGNTSFDNGEGQFKLSHNNGGCAARSNTVQTNLFLSKLPTQLVAAYESLADDLGSYGTFDRNIYARPFDDLVTIRAVKGVNGQVSGSDLTLGEWQQQSGQDATSTRSPVTYRNYTVTGLGNALLNQPFTNSSEDWSAWGPNNNTQIVQDKSGKLDGGSLRIGFSGASGKSDSFLYAFVNVGSVAKGKRYLLQFDAIGSGSGQKLPFFLRQREGNYQDLSSRTMVWIGPARQHYELAFTATADESKTLLITELKENGQSIWLDNLSLTEATLSLASPGDSIHIAYNPTSRDSLIQLSSLYKNQRTRNEATALQSSMVTAQSTAGSVQVGPFSSVVLMNNTSLPTGPASVDLSLSLRTNTRCARIGQAQTVTVTLHNDDVSPASGPVQWSCRLPANLSLLSAPGLTYQNGLLTGTCTDLSAGRDTSFVFSVGPQQAGQYRLAAQISRSPLPDPDSTPNSGTADGEDDTALIDARTDGTDSTLFESPNPSQRSLPGVISSQPTPNGSYTDLMLTSNVSRQAAAAGEVISLSLTVTNTGGRSSGAATVQCQLPGGLQFVDGANWTRVDNTLTATLTDVPVGSRQTVFFRARLLQTGTWSGNAQIMTCQASDIDSTPGNGCSNGEDDQVQIFLRCF